MRSASARARTQTGLWLLSKLLLNNGFAADTLAGIGFDANGRPTITGTPAFSISHSQALVACALSTDRNARVGLDVEYRRPIVPTKLARLMSAREHETVSANPNRFFDFWCAREATVKASGRVGLKRIRDIELGAERAYLDDRIWPLRALSLVDGYAACLASDRPFDEVTVERLTLPSGNEAV